MIAPDSQPGTASLTTTTESDSHAACLAVFEVLEGNETYVNQSPKGEPQLGRRGLYGTIGGKVRWHPDL